MKLVLFSDLHLDTGFSGTAASPEAARRRRQALRETLRNIVGVAQQVGANALLCGGDLYEHERFTPDTGAFLRATFSELHPLPVFIAPGNHDWYGPRSLYHQVDWTENVHIFAEPRLTPVTLAEGLTLWGAAHQAPAGTPGFLEGFSVDRGGVHLALFHGSEMGWLEEQEAGKQPHAPFWTRQLEEAGLHHALLGHYHRPRDDPRLTYPGNPDPLTFGEEGERGAVVVTVGNDGSVQRQRVRVAVSQVHDLVVDVTGAASQQEVRDRIRTATGNLQGFARVTLVGELDANVDLQPRDLERTTEHSLDALVVRTRDLRVPYDLAALRAEPTIRGEFVRRVEAAGLDEDERRRVLMTGLRALDGRGDLEVP